MKIKIIKTLANIALVVMAASCSKYVDVVPDNIAVIEDAFETRDSAERYLATLYGYMPPVNGINNPALAAGDEIEVNDNVSRNWASTTISRGGQNIISPRLSYWGTGSVTNLFQALRDCNIFIANIDKPFDITEGEKIKWIAEAKALKAYYHFYLMRMYGPIPIIDENIEVSAGVDAVRVSRDPVDEVANYIVQILDEAIADLPIVIEDEASELGRMTAPIAAAIKARTLATVASPLFNGNADYTNFLDADGNELISTTFDAEKWTRAATAAKEAIDLADQGGHFLYKFLEAPEIWTDTTVTELSIRGSIAERWNEEIVWGASGRTVSTLQNWAQAKIALDLSAETRESVQSYWNAPVRIAEMFYSENGVPIDEDINYNFANRFDVSAADAAHKYYIRTGFETANLNMNREPRFYASLGFDGGLWFGHGVKDDENSLIVNAKKGERTGKTDANRWGLSGYWPKKLVYFENVQRGTSSGYSNRAYPFPMVRLADLYLLYAEALNESGQTGQAIPWIDLIRERAGLDGVVNSWATASNNPTKPSTQAGLRDIIQDERMIELVFEGHRFWDLRRWKRASEFLNSDIRAWNAEGETTEDYYKIINVGTYKFLNRDYLWPISEADIIANSNLIQNPGW
ncbi:RagB/SusD family nutrient uptake outer membrane protein [Cellulophaga sp. F20128]|uniref:RagB/SusD family nutrient uptake outer membrane protein n=1 Tax=Cellulophaga sp. F20128 TaxID=2926413 RepID=UPI001FF3EB6A|nr:RagB/SusD family nutrient uptake outer membrane protein [Cellulophaga sp. F20128]MCK0155713.1 RagB/SusD family nutrient uptake outer membrane protein [Cellulophaga sp. F20128]